MCLIIKNKTSACAWLVVDPVQGYDYPLLPLFDSCTWIKCFAHPDSCLDFFSFGVNRFSGFAALCWNYCICLVIILGGNV